VSVILVDDATGRDLQVNGWNWGVLHAIVEAGRVLPTELWTPARWAGCGAKLEPTDVRALVHFLETQVLEQLRPGDRIDNEFKMTAAPTERRLRFDGQQNYSLERHVLEAVIEFLRAAGGAVSIL
jgi:hypothetical protein